VPIDPIFLLNLACTYSDTTIENIRIVSLKAKRIKMTIHHPPENLIVVDLPSKEIQIAEDLRAVNEIIGENPDCNVIIDFSSVEAITSSSLSNLIILRGLLVERGRRLILCNVSFITKCVFNVAGLEDVFEFVQDMPAAAAAVHSPN
jgi:anti-anti-sigma factor